MGRRAVLSRGSPSTDWVSLCWAAEEPDPAAAEAAELARGGAYKQGNSSTTCLEPNPSLHSMNPSLHSRKCTEPQGGFGGFTSSSSPLLPTRYALPHQPDARAFVFSGSQRWEFFFSHIPTLYPSIV